MSWVWRCVLLTRWARTMKGGGRSKEPLVTGEVAGKRPKRKCLQWHPLLSKKAFDFSEEEEEEDEEELDKVSANSSPGFSSRPLDSFQTESHNPWVAVSPAGGAVRVGAEPAGAVWKHGGGGGGGLQRAESPAAHERLPPLLQAPPLPGAAGAPASGQPRRHQDPGRLVGRPGAQREAKIHRHGQGGEQISSFSPRLSSLQTTRRQQEKLLTCHKYKSLSKMKVSSQTVWLGYHESVGGVKAVKWDNVITNIFSHFSLHGFAVRCSICLEVCDRTITLLIAALAVVALAELRRLIASVLRESLRGATLTATGHVPTESVVSHQRLKSLDLGVCPWQKGLCCLSRQTRKCCGGKSFPLSCSHLPEKPVSQSKLCSIPRHH